MSATLSHHEEAAAAGLKNMDQSVRWRLNASVSGCCLIIGFLLYFVILQFGSDYWIAMTLATVMLAASVIVLVNRSINSFTGEIDKLNYQVQVTEQNNQALKAEILRLNQCDELTGCANSDHFKQQVTRHIGLNNRSGLQFAILRLQIDKFDEFLAADGNRGSSELLKTFALILKGSIREVDITARLEDEQFAVVLSDTGVTGALLVANRIMKLTHQLQTNSKASDTLTLSIGVTEYHGTEDTTRLIQDAETAMSFASKEGGDRVAGYNYIEPRLAS